MNLSVKGMAWGSPEFVTVAKKVEEQGSANYQLDRLTEEITEAAENATQHCFMENRNHLKYVFELFDESDM